MCILEERTFHSNGLTDDLQAMQPRIPRTDVLLDISKGI